MAWAEQSLVHRDLELVLVPDIGGRLMDIRYQGASLLFQNPDLLSTEPDLQHPENLPTRAKHLAFPLWGGEKTWIAPDSNWSEGAPYPVLDSGKYSYQQQSSRSATMVSSVCPLSSLQITREIKITGNNSWTIRHVAANHGTDKRMVGLWSVMMTRRPANYYFNSAHHKPVTVFGDADDAFACSDNIGQITCDSMKEFKLGCHPANGVSFCHMPTSIGNIWILNRVNTLAKPGAYAHGHAMEFYNSGHYHYGELEWHSPLCQLQPGFASEFYLHYRIHVSDIDLTPAEIFELMEPQSNHQP